MLSLLTELSKGYLRYGLSEMDAGTGSVLASCSVLTEALGNMRKFVLTKRLEHLADVWRLRAKSLLSFEDCFFELFMNLSGCV